MSSLKEREYLAKGLPIVSGITVDIFEGISNIYYLEFPADNSAIDIKKIVDFYDTIYVNQDKNEVRRQIRAYAERTVDIRSTMEPIIRYIKK